MRLWLLLGGLTLIIGLLAGYLRERDRRVANAARVELLTADWREEQERANGLALELEVSLTRNDSLRNFLDSIDAEASRREGIAVSNLLIARARVDSLLADAPDTIRVAVAVMQAQADTAYAACSIRLSGCQIALDSADILLQEALDLAETRGRLIARADTIIQTQAEMGSSWKSRIVTGASGAVIACLISWAFDEDEGCF